MNRVIRFYSNNHLIGIKIMNTNFVNINRVKVGQTIQQDLLEEWVGCTSVHIDGKQWTGDFVTFAGGSEPVTNGNHLTQAPNGVTIHIREHYSRDVYAVKKDGKWVVTTVDPR